MAIKIFTGNAALVTDVWTFTVVTYSNATVLGITCNGKTVSITLSGSGYTAATAAAALQALLAASTYGEFLEYTWTVSDAVITGTARVSGVPGTFTNASTGGTAGTLSNSTAASGPNFLSVAANWTGGTLPTNSDSVVFDRFSPSALYGLTALSALTGLTIETIDFPNSIGLPAVRGSANGFDPNSGGGYPEYRTRYMLLSAGTPTLNIGRGSLVPTRVNIEFGGSAAATAVNVFGSAPPAAGEVASVFIQGLTGMDALNVTQGWVGVAAEIGQTGGFTVVRIGSEDNPNTDAHVHFGAGATVPSIENQSGSSTSEVTVTALTMRSRAIQHRQTAGSISGSTVQGGLLLFESPGSLTIAASGKARVDFSRDPRPKTIASGSTFEDDASLFDPAGTCTTMNCTFTGRSLQLSDLGPSTAVVRT